MTRSFLISVWFWIVLLLLCSQNQSAQAATMPINENGIGQVIKIASRRFVKVNSNGEFMALETPIIMMQEFSTVDCAAYPKPAAVGYTPVGTMMDARDGKLYEIRKFADGKCWMADDLAYGGTTDDCADRTALANANGSATPSNRFGAGTYGDCYAGSLSRYAYNWQAVMQLPSAYYNVNVTYPVGTPTTSTNFIRGICPEGWHVPAGGTSQSTSEWAALDIANGGTGVNRSGCSTAACKFFTAGKAFKARTDDPDGYVTWWSSTQINAIGACRLLANNANLLNVCHNYNAYQKNYPATLRCVKN